MNRDSLPEMTVQVATGLHQNLHAKRCCRSLDSSLKHASNVKNARLLHMLLMQ